MDIFFLAIIILEFCNELIGYIGYEATRDD